MSRAYLAGLAAALITVVVAPAAQAQQPTRPQIETTKVDGTDNVYIFRNGNHQSMFVVTKDGVIATDPVAYGRPTGGQTYVDEIKKVTDKPIKYLIYSHHHFDHIAGGKAFKDAGATHHRAQEGQGAARAAQRSEHGAARRDRSTARRPSRSAAPRSSCSYLGLNHSDSTLVMRLPKEKIIFVVDTIPVGSVPGPRHDRHLSARDRGLHQEGASRWTGSG